MEDLLLHDLLEAMRLVTDQHELLTDKCGSPLVGHPARVMLYLAQDFEPSETQLIAALLHGVVEDTDTTLDQLVRWFGEEVADLVEALTRAQDETYADYIERIINFGPDAIEVKLADLRDNMDARRIPPDHEYEKEHSSLVAKRYVKAVTRLEGALPLLEERR